MSDGCFILALIISSLAIVEVLRRDYRLKLRSNWEPGPKRAPLDRGTYLFERVKRLILQAARASSRGHRENALMTRRRMRRQLMMLIPA
jgi:hypothetical protein